MEVLISTAVLGLLCMVAELFGLRKLLVPLVAVGFSVIIGLAAMAWDTDISYYNNMFRFDNYAIAFSGLILLLGLAIVLLSGDFYKDEPQHWSDYLAIFVFTIAGCIVLTGYTNLVMLFLGIEILSICLYIMAGSDKRNLSSNEAGMKYFLMGSFASGFLLFGIALIYGATGTFDLNVIAEVLPGVMETNSALIFSGMLMMLVGMFFKVSAVPFHFWSPDVYQGSPSLVTAFMATIAKLSAIAAFYRLISMGFIDILPDIRLVLAIVTVATISIGNIVATAQQNFKRVLAFSGISHAGYLLLGILCADQQTSGEILFYAVAYGVANIAAFGVSIAVFRCMGSEDISAFNGLMKKKPFLAICLTIAMLSLASIPPLSGFWAKYLIFSEAIRGGFLWITIVGIVNTLIGVFYYFKVIRAMMLEPADEKPITISIPYIAVILVATIATIGAGLIPSLLMHVMDQL